MHAHKCNARNKHTQRNVSVETIELCVETWIPMPLSNQEDMICGNPLEEVYKEYVRYISSHVLFLCKRLHKKHLHEMLQLFSDDLNHTLWSRFKSRFCRKLFGRKKYCIFPGLSIWRRCAAQRCSVGVYVGASTILPETKAFCLNKMEHKMYRRRYDNVESGA